MKKYILALAFLMQATVLPTAPAHQNPAPDDYTDITFLNRLIQSNCETGRVDKSERILGINSEIRKLAWVELHQASAGAVIGMAKNAGYEEYNNAREVDRMVKIALKNLLFAALAKCSQ